MLRGEFIHRRELIRKVLLGREFHQRRELIKNGLIRRGEIPCPEIRELQRYAIFSTACSIVYKYCTRPISKHLYSGIFKDPLTTKHKIFMFKIGVFFLSCKT